MCGTEQSRAQEGCGGGGDRHSREVPATGPVHLSAHVRRFNAGGKPRGRSWSHGQVWAVAGGTACRNRTARRRRWLACRASPRFCGTARTQNLVEPWPSLLPTARTPLPFLLCSFRGRCMRRQAPVGRAVLGILSRQLLFLDAHKQCERPRRAATTHRRVQVGARAGRAVARRARPWAVAARRRSAPRRTARHVHRPPGRRGGRRIGKCSWFAWR
jgi:hypothetical protein